MILKKDESKVGDVLLIPLVSENERKKSKYGRGWKPHPDEPCLIAQVIFVFRVSVSIAVYSEVFTYSEELGEQIKLEDLTVSHLIQTQDNYISWGSFKRIRNETVNPNTPFQLYRFLHRSDTVTISTEQGPVFSTPDFARNLDLMSSYSSCTGEAVVELMKHIHVKYISDGYEDMSKKYSVRPGNTLRKLLGSEYGSHDMITSIIERCETIGDPLNNFSVAPTNLTLQDFYDAVENDPKALCSGTRM